MTEGKYTVPLRLYVLIVYLSEPQKKNVIKKRTSKDINGVRESVEVERLILELALKEVDLTVKTTIRSFELTSMTGSTYDLICESQ